MDQSEYKKIIDSGEQALGSARRQSEHPTMEKYSLLLKNIVSRRNAVPSDKFLRSEQIQASLLAEKLVPLVSHGSFLEIGCGFDPFIIRHHKIADSYYLDLFENGLKESKSKFQGAGLGAGALFLKADLNESLPFKNNSLDNIVLMNTSGAIKQYEEFSGKIWDILKPEGKLIICGDAEPNTLQGSSGSFYLNNKLWVHEILKKLNLYYSVKIYVAGPVMPWRESEKFRENSRKGEPVSEAILKTGEFTIQEATQRMLKFASGKLVQTREEYKELTETVTNFGKKYFLSYTRIVIAEKRLSQKGWDALTGPEKEYVATKLQLSITDKALLEKLNRMSRKDETRDPEELKRRINELLAEGQKMDIFSLKKAFPKVFSLGKKKKIKKPLQACIDWLEKELEKACGLDQDERIISFKNKPGVKTALDKSKFMDTRDPLLAVRLMKEMDL